MIAIIDFTDYLVHAALNLMMAIVFVYVILSWLIQFQVINTRNPWVFRIARALEGVAGRLLAPIQRFMPNLGGLDFSPIVFLVVVGGVDRYLRPGLFGWLRSIVGG